MNKQSIPAKSRTLNDQVSAMTASRQTALLNPNASPATEPQTTRRGVGSTGFQPGDAVLFSRSIVPPLDTIKVTRPLASAEATTEPAPTRHAMFEKGSNST